MIEYKGEMLSRVPVAQTGDNPCEGCRLKEEPCCTEITGEYVCADRDGGSYVWSVV